MRDRIAHADRASHAGRAIEHTHAHVMPGLDPQDVQQVMGARVGEADVAAIPDFAGLEHNQIHERARGLTS